MENTKNYLEISSWYSDIQIKGKSFALIPENEKTIEMCFVAIHYWGAALEYVPEKYKTYELCLDAVRHNTPVDEGCSALAFVPDKLKTYELCLEAIRHDYLISAFWDNGYSVEWDYTAAINFVPKNLRTPELCFEVLLHYPSCPPDFYNFIDSDSMISGDELIGSVRVAKVTPKLISDILNSSELFMESLKRIGMPEEYNKDAMKYFEKIKTNLLDNGIIKGWEEIKCL